MTNVLYRPRKILIALDGSDASRFALAYAAGLAACVGDPPMIALQVVPTLTFMPSIPGSGPVTGDLVEQNRVRQEQIHQQLSEEIAPYRERFDWEVEACPGSGGAAVAREAEERGVQLIVAGSHGRTGARRVLLGSFAEQLIRHSTVPVLVIRQPTGGSPDSPDKAPPAFPPSRVIAPTDFSKPAWHGVKFAASLAAACEAPLQVLHVLKEDGDPEAAEATWLTELEQMSPDAPMAPLRIITGDAPEAIAEAAGEQPGAIVVISSKGRTGAARLLLGSVAEKTARTAPCPVLIVK